MKGPHYKLMANEPVDYIIANGIPFCEGNVIKYVSRWRNKGGLDDLRKAQNYIQKIIDHESNNLGRQATEHQVEDERAEVLYQRVS